MAPLRLLAPALALAVLLAAPGEAGADAAPEERAGFLAGAGIGPGRLALGCGGCGDLAPLDQALSVSAHAGALLGPRLALVVEYWMIRWEGRDNTWFEDSADHVVQESLASASGQLWLGRRLWLRAGVGVSRHRTDVDYRSLDPGPVPAAGAKRPPPPDSGRAPALVGAIGYEIIYTPELSIDFALRAGASKRGERGLRSGLFAATLGATWF